MSKIDWLPNDVTIPDLFGKLKDQVRYVRGIYFNMIPDKTKYPSLRVRIGRTGGGSHPYYRIEREGPNAEKVVLGFYQGAGHKPLAKTFEDHHGETWSTRTLSYLEVQELHNKFLPQGSLTSNIF